MFEYIVVDKYRYYYYNLAMINLRVTILSMRTVRNVPFLIFKKF